MATVVVMSTSSTNSFVSASSRMLPKLLFSRTTQTNHQLCFITTKTHHYHRRRRKQFFAANRQTALLSSSSSSDSSTIAMTTPKEEEEICPLLFEKLPYSGAQVKVDDNLMKEYNDDDTEFLSKLRSSLEYWKKKDYISAWLHIPVSHARLIETLTSKKSDDFDFDLHHISNNNIILKKWLVPEWSEDKIPPYATHQVGCAGFVLNDQNELLVIREWSGSPSNRLPSKQWKLPGGLLDLGESFEEATQREVYEETGIETEFESILTFWHRHDVKPFGKSDLYFVCLLKPIVNNNNTTTSVQEQQQDQHDQEQKINIDPMEVSSAKWMSIQEFVSTQDHPLINYVLQHNFGIETDNQSIIPQHNKKRLVPHATMTKGFVQWPNRPKIPTYSTTKSKPE